MSNKLTKVRLIIAGILLCAIAPSAHAQGGPITGQAFRYTPSGLQYFPGATITVCASNATVPLNGVCFPAENDANCCFTNAAMSVASPNPTVADSFANYPPLFGTPGNYIVCISGNNATTRCSPYVIPCVPSAVVAGCATNAGLSRLQIAGTPLVSGDFSVPSAGGWGTGATITNIVGSDSGFQFTITAGTSPSIAPTITLTFHDGPWTAINSVSANWIGGTGNAADVQQSNNLSSITLTYLDLPVATKTYTFSVLLSGRSNVIPVTSTVNPVVLNPSGFQTITNFGLGVPSLTAANLSTFNGGLTGTGNIGNLDLGSKAISTPHTWTGVQTFPNGSISCAVLIGGCPSSGTQVSVNGTSQGSAVNFGSLPAVDANNIQVTWKQGSGNSSAEVPGSGNGATFCTVSGSLPSGHQIAADANGNCVDGGLDQDFTRTACQFSANSTDNSCSTSFSLPVAYADFTYFIQITPELNVSGTPVLAVSLISHTSSTITYDIGCTFGCSAISGQSATLHVHTHHN
jgi:hypothetical protein